MLRIILRLFGIRRGTKPVKAPMPLPTDASATMPNDRQTGRSRESAAQPRNKGEKWQPRPPPNLARVYKKMALSDGEVRKRTGHLAEGRVLQIVDGDTVVIMIGRDENLVRLDSIDCPEGMQPWGEEALIGLKSLIGGRLVGVEQHGQDPYGRTLATVYAWHDTKDEMINVNEYMVMLGHAWVMRLYYDHLPAERQQNLVRLEKWARSKRIGLWSEPNPMPPWKWRNTK